MLYLNLILIVLLLVDARWRSAWLRVPLVLFFLLALRAVTLGPAYRRAVAVTMNVPASATFSSEYHRGVQTMLGEGERDLNAQIAFPSAVLAWLAISPLVLDRWLPAMLAAWRRRQQAGEVGPGYSK